ncbi:response regulator [Gymnodinialimonas sp.]
MKTDPRARFEARPEPSGGGPNVLAVALSPSALSQMPRHVLAPDAHVSLSTLARVTAAEVTGADAPDLILAPLTARGFDAMDLLGALTEADYRGRILVLTPHMPDVPLVRADVLAQAPALNVDVIALDGSSALHLL